MVRGSLRWFSVDGAINRGESKQARVSVQKKKHSSPFLLEKLEVLRDKASVLWFLLGTFLRRQQLMLVFIVFKFGFSSVIGGTNGQVIFVDKRRWMRRKLSSQSTLSPSTSSRSRIKLRHQSLEKLNPNLLDPICPQSLNLPFDIIFDLDSLYRHLFFSPAVVLQTISYMESQFPIPKDST